MESSFREVSIQLNKCLLKEERQKQGIFFTPRDARVKLFEQLKYYTIQPRTILEPSFGSGEFLMDLAEQYPESTIYGVEFNKTLFDTVRNISTLSSHRLYHCDFLKWTAQEPMDMIIGNPPYFVVKDKNPACMTGRGNIFVQFIYKCIHEHLAEGGILAFVLPTSFYNCSYYEPCRKYIKEHTTILHVETIQTHYYDTCQETMLLILKKEPLRTNSSNPNPSNSFYPYLFIHRNNHFHFHYISPYARELSEMVSQGKITTLKELGFQVKTGSVVWNQHKHRLTDEPGTLVIYSSNLVQCQLVLNNLKKDKKQYIQNYDGDPVTGPAILVSRGYGNKFSFNYVFIDSGQTFYGENHVNIITPTTTGAIPYIKSILTSFADPKTLTFIKMFVGNGALSKTELETVLPIFQ